MAHTLIQPVEPYDLELSLRVTRSLSPDAPDDPTLRVAVRVGDHPRVLEVKEAKGGLSVEVESSDGLDEAAEIAGRMLFADLDLGPFYEKVSSHEVLGPITRKFDGVKPLRPASLFEMLVVAITEQQLTMAAAVSIRQQLLERFGDPVDGLFVFPGPGPWPPPLKSNSWTAASPTPRPTTCAASRGGWPTGSSTSTRWSASRTTKSARS
jgi:DNA-3-methyladenine glycosylase II